MIRAVFGFSWLMLEGVETWRGTCIWLAISRRLMMTPDDQNYGYVRIDRGNYVTVGRGYLSDRFQYSDCVSGRHVMISYCFAGDPDGVIIEDLHSTNGTGVECADGPTGEVRIR